MPRRALSLTLLVVLAVQLIGAVALASACLEPCPDDGEGTSCPPVCTLCTDCTHAQPQAIVRNRAGGALVPSGVHMFPPPSSAASSRRGCDIFHVPLHG